MGDLLRLDIGDLRLAYRADGSPGAPPLVLLHALGENGTDWAEVAADLADTFRVYVPDLRGHGASGWPGTYSLELMRDDMSAFLDRLGLDQVTLVGHSLGGLVACLMAEDRPDRVARLVLEEGVPMLPADPPRVLPPRPDGPLGFDWEVVVAITGQRNAPDPAWRDRLAAVTAPTLVIAGGPGSHVPQAELAEAAARIPQARLVTIAADHFVHATRPAEFRAELRGFLAPSGMVDR
jgi:pimeloyl-ACP methyl ester carboxylesterase